MSAKLFYTDKRVIETDPEGRTTTDSLTSESTAERPGPVAGGDRRRGGGDVRGGRAAAPGRRRGGRREKSGGLRMTVTDATEIPDALLQES